MKWLLVMFTIFGFCSLGHGQQISRVIEIDNATIQKGAAVNPNEMGGSSELHLPNGEYKSAEVSCQSSRNSLLKKTEFLALIASGWDGRVIAFKFDSMTNCLTAKSALSEAFMTGKKSTAFVTLDLTTNRVISIQIAQIK